jgi:hypothetical protein
VIGLVLTILAQDDWELPTLSRDLGLHFENPDGTIAIDFSGRQKLTLFVISDEGTMNVKKDASLFYPTTDLFVDIVAWEKLELFLDLRIDRHIPPEDRSMQTRVEAWWIRWTTPSPIELRLQFGKFPSPIGQFIPRHDTPQDVLPFRPLAYVTVTNFRPNFTQGQLLASKDAPRLARYGRMLIWEELYATGAMAFGSHGPFHYRAAITNNAPSGGPKWWGFNEADDGNLNLSGFFGFTPWIGLKLGFSFSTGPYLHEGEARIGAADRTELLHDLLGASVELSYGHFALYAEYFHHRIEAANISDDLEAHSGYAELQVKLMPGLAAALRYNQNMFSELGGRDWDNATGRFEAGVRWSLVKGLVVRGQILLTESTGNDPDDPMGVLQVMVHF